MAKRLRILFTALLLLLFTTENLLVAAAWDPGDKSSEHQTELISHEWHGSFCQLAEGSEERDHRDYDNLSLVRVLVHPCLFPDLHTGKVHRADYFVVLHDTTPRYTRFRTLII